MKLSTRILILAAAIDTAIVALGAMGEPPTGSPRTPCDCPAGLCPGQTEGWGTATQKGERS